MTDVFPTYWLSRFVFERALALMYVVAFLCAANQFVPLLGAHGLMPVSRFVRVVPFRAAPSVFYLFDSDTAFRTASWLGVALATLLFTGSFDRIGWVSATLWAALWVLYLSFVNVGQIFYGFGWESLLLETGFFAIFLGSSAATPSAPLLWIWRWVLFRIMFGAGLIKLRGDSCWHDLTCLNYYFETQPMPNALSWYFHWLPAGVHRAGVIFNHVAELGVPQRAARAVQHEQPAGGTIGEGVLGDEPRREVVIEIRSSVGSGHGLDREPRGAAPGSAVLGEFVRVADPGPAARGLRRFTRRRSSAGPRFGAA